MNRSSRGISTISGFPFRTSAIALAVAACPLVSPTAQAASRFWDGGVDTGTTSTGTSWGSDNNWVGDTIPATGDDLIFQSGRAGSGTAGYTTTTVTSPLSLGNSFNVKSVTFDGSLGKLPAALVINPNGSGGTTTKTLTLTGTGTSTFLSMTGYASAAAVTFNSTTNGLMLMALGSSGAIDVTEATSTLTLNPNISGGTFGLTKTGLGTLVFGGTNTYSGATAVNGGTLQLAATGSIANSALAIGSNGTFAVAAGHGSSAVTGTTLNGGAANISVPSLTAGSTFGLGAITRTAGSTVNFTLPTTGSLTTTTANAANGIVGPYATVGGTTWAVSASNGTAAAALSGLGSYDTSYATAGAASHFDATSTGTFTGTGVNTLRFNAAAATTATLNGDFVVGSGGILFSSNIGANAATLTGGNSLTSGGTELVVHQYNTGAAAVIGTPIVNNGGASLNFVKAGAGALTLGAANTFTGTTQINTGSLKLANTLALQNSTLVTSSLGGTLAFDTAAAYTLGGLSGNGPVVLTNTAATPAGVALSVGANNASTTYSGLISGLGSLVKVGSGTLTISGNNSYSGGLVINAGVVAASNTTVLNGISTTGTPPTITINDGATFRFTATGSWIFNSGRTIAVPSGVGTFDVPNAGGVFNSNGAVSGSGTLLKTGSGTLVLNNSSSYTGGLDVAGGTLRFTTSGAVPAGDVTIRGGGAFVYSNSTTGTIILTGRNFYVGTGGGSIDANNANQTFALPGVIADAAGVVTPGTLTKTGTNTLAFTGANSYTGTTVISAGTLQIGTGTTGTLGTGDVTDNATLAFGRTNTHTVANNISGTGAVTQIGAAGLTILTGSNAYSGGTTITAGALEYRKTLALPATGAITVAAGTTAALGVGGTGQFTTATADAFRTTRATFAAGSFFGLDTADAIGGYTHATVIADAPAGSIGLAKIGTNALTLTAINTYTGGTNISGGTLNVGDGTVEGALGSGNVIDNGALVFNTLGTQTVSGVISGAGSVTKEGTGTLVLSPSASNTFSGGLTINNGVIEVSATLPLGSASVPTVINGGTLRFTATASSTTRGTQINSATSTIDVPNSAVTFTAGGAIAGSGTLNKTGAGTLFVNNSTNSFTGGVTINAGTFGIGTNGALGPTSGTIGPVTINNDATMRFDLLSGGNPVLAANRNFVVGSANSKMSVASGETWTINGDISGAGTLNKVDTGTLYLNSGNSTYAGGTVVSAGVLRANNGATGSATGTGDVTVNAGGTFGGNGTITGAVTVNAGGTITAGADAGTPGTLRTGDQTWAGGKYLWKTLASSGTAGTTWDLLSIGALSASSGFTVQAALGTGGTFVAPAPNSGTTTYQIAHTTNTTDINVESLFVLDTSALGVSPGAGTFALSFEPGGGGGYDLNLNFQAAPEPTTFALVGLGAVSVLGRRRRNLGGQSVLGMLCGTR